jgi:hypothetical protein
MRRWHDGSRHGHRQEQGMIFACAPCDHDAGSYTWLNRCGSATLVAVSTRTRSWGNDHSKRKQCGQRQVYSHAHLTYRTLYRTRPCADTMIRTVYCTCT